MCIRDSGSIIKKAFYIAATGKPGVVLVDIPTDIQKALGSDSYPDTVEVRGYRPKPSVHIGQLRKALELLNRSARPLFLVTGAVNIARAGREMTRLRFTLYCRRNRKVESGLFAYCETDCCDS